MRRFTSDRGGARQRRSNIAGLLDELGMTAERLGDLVMARVARLAARYLLARPERVDRSRVLKMNCAW